MARLAEPLMKAGECLFTMSYYGANKVVDNYGIMGLLKAAPESTVRCIAVELGSKRIRVHALSAGPLKTRAASGIKDFDQLFEEAAAEAPNRNRISVDDVGAVAACLESDAAAVLIGHTACVGMHIRV